MKTIFFILIFTSFVFSVSADNKNALNLYKEYKLSLSNFEFGDLNDTVSKIIDKGFNKDDIKISELLKKYQKDIDYFKEFILKIDLNDKSTEEIINGEFPTIVPILRISKLVIVEGKVFESENKIKEAIDNYLKVLAMSNLITKEQSLVSFLISLKIKPMAYKSLKNIDFSKIEKEELVKINEQLKTIFENSLSFENALKTELKMMINLMKKDFSLDKMSNFQKEFGIPMFIENKEKFLNDLIVYLEMKQTQLFNKIIAASNPYSESEFEKINDSFQKDSEQNKNTIYQFVNIGNLLHINLLYIDNDYTPLLTVLIGDILTSIATPNYESYVKKYEEVKQNYKELKLIIENKLK